MKLKDFFYKLPPELIAQAPARPRDQARLLILNRDSGKLEDKHFSDLVDYLFKGDILIVNNTKVFPARLIGRKQESGGKIEVFLLKAIGGAKWQCLIGGKSRRVGLKIEFKRGLTGEIVKDNQDGTWQVNFNKRGQEFRKIVEAIGLVPLPPYIKRGAARATDKKDYQTIFSKEKKIGSVAAPTAGLHFTPRLVKKLKARGIEIVNITLHVGLGTFAPVKEEDITKHKMHAEWAEISKGILKKIQQAKKRGGRVIAVGTTSVRTLEAAWSSPGFKNKKEFTDWVNLFIYPGFKFKIVDAMVTNFHLPESTLLMLVSALAGRGNINKAYNHAIRKKYRFYSYGDAMLII